MDGSNESIRIMAWQMPPSHCHWTFNVAMRRSNCIWINTKTKKIIVFILTAIRSVKSSSHVNLSFVVSCLCRNISKSKWGKNTVAIILLCPHVICSLNPQMILSAVIFRILAIIFFPRIKYQMWSHLSYKNVGKLHQHTHTQNIYLNYAMTALHFIFRLLHLHRRFACQLHQ